MHQLLKQVRRCCMGCLRCLVRKHLTGAAASVLPGQARRSRGVRLIFLALVLFMFGFTGYQVTKLTTKYIRFDPKTTVSLESDRFEDLQIVVPTSLTAIGLPDRYDIYRLTEEVLRYVPLYTENKELLTVAVRRILPNFTDDQINDLAITTALLEYLLDGNRMYFPTVDCSLAVGDAMPNKLYHLYNHSKLSCFIKAYDACYHDGIFLSDYSEVVSRAAVWSIFLPGWDCKPEYFNVSSLMDSFSTSAEENFSFVSGIGSITTNYDTVGLSFHAKASFSCVKVNLPEYDPSFEAKNRPFADTFFWDDTVLINPKYQDSSVPIRKDGSLWLRATGARVYEFSDRYCNPKFPDGQSITTACRDFCGDEFMAKVSGVCVFGAEYSKFSLYNRSRYRGCKVSDVLDGELQYGEFSMVLRGNVLTRYYLRASIPYEEAELDELDKERENCYTKCDSGDISSGRLCRYSSTDVFEHRNTFSFAQCGGLRDFYGVALDNRTKVSPHDIEKRVTDKICITRTDVIPVTRMEEDYPFTDFLADLSGQLGFAVSILSGIKVAAFLWAKAKNMRANVRNIRNRLRNLEEKCSEKSNTLESAMADVLRQNFGINVIVTVNSEDNDVTTTATTEHPV